jgi:hypothetical protein
MNRKIALLSAALISSAAFLVAGAGAQNNSSAAPVVNTAYITKIDAKKMVIHVKTDGTQPDTGVAGTGSTGAGGRRGGGGRDGGGYGGATGVGVSGGRGRRGGTVGGYPGGTAPAAGTAANSSKVREFKVYLTKETVVRDGETTVTLNDLKVGDHIVLSGNSKGNDVEALSIEKDPN